MAITGVHRQLEQVKHADKSHAAETVAGLLLSIEALASFILID